MKKFYYFTALNYDFMELFQYSLLQIIKILFQRKLGWAGHLWGLKYINKDLRKPGFPTRAGSDPIISPIEALKMLPALWNKKLPALQKFQGW